MSDDFRFIAVTPFALSTVILPQHQRSFYWLVLLAPLFLISAVYLWKQRMDFFAQNPDKLKSKKAPRLANRLLSTARAAINEGNPGQVYAALSKAVTDYISHRWNLSCAGLTTNELRHAMQKCGVPEDCCESVVNALEEFDRARFSGDRSEIPEMRKAYQRTESVLSALMKQKTRKG